MKNPRPFIAPEPHPNEPLDIYGRTEEQYYEERGVLIDDDGMLSDFQRPDPRLPVVPAIPEPIVTTHTGQRGDYEVTVFTCPEADWARNGVGKVGPSLQAMYLGHYQRAHIDG